MKLIGNSVSVVIANAHTLCSGSTTGVSACKREDTGCYLRCYIHGFYTLHHNLNLFRRMNLSGIPRPGMRKVEVLSDPKMSYWGPSSTYVVLLYVSNSKLFLCIPNSRDIQAETTEMFYSSTGLPGLAHSDVNYEVVLGNCNRKLTQWMDTWEFQMKRGTCLRSHLC
jgi:hypothetical protein